MIKRIFLNHIYLYVKCITYRPKQELQLISELLFFDHSAWIFRMLLSLVYKYILKSVLFVIALP